MRANYDPDRAILRLARGEIAGPPRGAWQLMDHAWPSLTRFVQQRLVYRGAPERSVQDCGQNVFRRVWKYRKGYRGATEAEWWAWVRRITDNELRRYMSSEGRHPLTQTDLEARAGVAEDESLEPGSNVDRSEPTVDAVIDHESADEIRDCLGRLPKLHRKIVELIYLRGELSERAVAGLLDCSPSYVHKVKSQAIEKLRRCMESKGVR